MGKRVDGGGGRRKGGGETVWMGNRWGKVIILKIILIKK